MTGGNGKAEPDALDLEHELPAESAEEQQSQPADVEQLKAELEKVRTERDSYLDRLARVQAEFENFRKRTAREQQDFREYAAAEAVKSLLPIMDSLDRALAAPSDGGEFRAGIELISRQFHDALAKLGVEPVKAVGERFDPQYHQALQMVETAEAEDNHVIDELQRGYKIKDRLLRPAMVRVARNPGK